MLERFSEWLSNPVNWTRLLVICTGILIVSFAYDEVMVRLTGVVYKILPDINEFVDICDTTDKECREFFEQFVRDMTWFIKESPFYMYVPVLVLLAFGEELFFRWLPLIISVRWIGVRDSLIFIVVPFSLIFGWMHYMTWDMNALLGSTLIHGVAGIVLSIIYLKAGGSHKRHSRALLFSTSFHTVYNIIVLTTARYFDTW